MSPLGLPRRDRRALGPLRTALVAAALALPVAGCGVGPDAQTLGDWVPGEGTMNQAGEMRILNALVVIPEDGEGPGVLSMTIANDGDQADEVVELLVNGSSIQLEGPSEIPGETSVRFGGPDAAVTAYIEEAGDELRAGPELLIRFADNGSVVLNPPVYFARDYYEQVVPPLEPGEETLPPPPNRGADEPGETGAPGGDPPPAPIDEAPGPSPDPTTPEGEETPAAS